MARRAPASRRRATRTARRNSGSDLGARVVAAVPAIVLAIVLVAAGGWPFAIGMLVFAVLCMGEYFTLMAAAHPVRLGGFLGLIGLIVAAHLGGPSSLLGAAMATVPIVFLASRLQSRAGAAGLATTYFGLFWIGLAFAHAVLLRDLPHGNAIVIDVLVGTFIGDTGAYLGGRAIGQTPLAPSISPNKTLEGLGIGLVTAVAAVWFAGLYQDWLSGTQALGLGLAVAVAAPVGDLFESYLKRDRAVKDTGRVFGAHGGALDRLDAVMFSIVAGYYVWHAMV